MTLAIVAVIAFVIGGIVGHGTGYWQACVDCEEDDFVERKMF